jgi:hypothetical protein
MYDREMPGRANDGRGNARMSVRGSRATTVTQVTSRTPRGPSTSAQVEEKRHAEARSAPQRGWLRHPNPLPLSAHSVPGKSRTPPP